ncbi:MAG: UDP-N-acetylmuramate dehydrogenase [Pyrinomonadaceae bacterium]
MTKLQTKLLLQENIPLAPLTTLKVGGAARFFVEAKTRDEIIEAVEFAEKNNLPLFILGGGSNVLISDDGFDGLVLHINRGRIATVIERYGNVFIRVDAGVDWDRFVTFCVNRNLAGLECLSGIPGLVGATPIQNVGAYGQEVSETILVVSVLDRKTGEVFEMRNADCQFSYRASIFNTTEKNRYIVLYVVFVLKQNGAPKIVYRDLREFFGERTPTLKETRAAVLKIRRAKSMIIRKSDPNSKSAGSFFKNPIVTNEKFAEVVEKAESLKIEKVPQFKVDEKTVKIPAAWLIEQSGFHKGFKLGNAGISTRHTLAIVNLGDATARDILNLKDEIQAKVKERFNIELKPEPVFVGFGKN